MFIDSHCHLNFPELLQNLDDYLLQMQLAKVTHALCIGTRVDNLDSVVSIANKHHNIYAAVGIHPDEVIDDNIDIKELLNGYIANNKKVIGVGETGLDYYHIDITENIDNKHRQIEKFKSHIEIANIHQLPLIIHTRNAINDTLDILQKYNDNTQSKVIMHCFTEDHVQAQRCVNMGYYISISGIVTFKNAKQVQDMASIIPLDRLLIETDSPFLAPMPYRGKTNHPALIVYTANYLANLKQINVAELARVTTNNFCHIFNKFQPLDFNYIIK